MRLQHCVRGVVFAALAIVVCAAQPGEARAQAWKPDKPVEIIVPTGAAGINDSNSRLIQKTLQGEKLITVPALVVNKPGGNQSLAPTYLNQHPGDPHYLFYATATLFTNQLAGVTPIHYKDLTPLALLLVDYTVITVKTDSPMKDMRDLVQRLKADPESKFTRGRELSKFLDTEYAATRAVMTDIGLLK